jgi:hypothetical protein
MSTSKSPSILPDDSTSSRGPLRLRMAKHPGRNRLDGGWWPRSRDLMVELADLVDHFPAQFGRIVRVSISPPDWDAAPRRIAVADGYVKAGSLPRDDTHLIRLKTSGGSMLHVLVVPPGFTDDQGAETLLASSTTGNAHSATALLDEATDQPDIDPVGHWNDDGGSWWGPHPVVAPSWRTGG